MGLLDGISAGLSAATKAATGAAQGQQQGSQLLRAIQMQQYQIEKEQAETNLARTHAKYFQRESDTPRLGDPNYGTALGDAKAGEIRGATPAKAEEVTALAQPTADAAATMVNTTAQPKANAAALEASATLPMKKDLDAYSTNQRTRGAIATAAGTAPIEVKKAKDIADATQPGKIALERAKLDNQPLRQDEAYTAMHLPRIAQSIGVIQQATAPGAWQKIASRGMLGNYTLTPEGQRYNAAVHRAALSLAVTLEGPRGATPQRVDMVEKTYFPQPGDDDTTVAAKIQQLKEAVRSGVTKAGRGYERMNPQDRAAIDQFIGERPATDAPVGHPITSKYGITPSVP